MDGLGYFQEILVEKESQTTKIYKAKLVLHLLFIDFQEAYDSIERDILFGGMKKLGIPRNLRKIAEMTLSTT